MKKERIERNFWGAGFGGAGFDSCICLGIDSCLNSRLNSRLNARLASGGAESRTSMTLIASLIIIAITSITAMTAIKEAMAILLFWDLER